jgi:hypothetical protein
MDKKTHWKFWSMGMMAFLIVVVTIIVILVSNPNKVFSAPVSSNCCAEFCKSKELVCIAYSNSHILCKRPPRDNEFGYSMVFTFAVESAPRTCNFTKQNISYVQEEAGRIAAGKSVP